jgi:hypothetical protein
MFETLSTSFLDKNVRKKKNEYLARVCMLPCFYHVRAWPWLIRTAKLTLPCMHAVEWSGVRTWTNPTVGSEHTWWRALPYFDLVPTVRNPHAFSRYCPPTSQHSRCTMQRTATLRKCYSFFIWKHCSFVSSDNWSRVVVQANTIRNTSWVTIIPFCAPNKTKKTYAEGVIFDSYFFWKTGESCVRCFSIWNIIDLTRSCILVYHPCILVYHRTKIHHPRKFVT